MVARAQASAATGERLLAAAWTRFATVPYEDVRLRDIAADAAVTVQTLHAHFGSKDALLAAAYTRWADQEVQRRDAARVGRVGEAIRLAYDTYEAHGDAIMRILAQEDRIPAMRELTNRGRAYHRDWAKTTFAPLLRDLPPAARERRLTTIVIATDVLVWKLLRRDYRKTRDEAERTVALMIQTTPPHPRPG